MDESGTSTLGSRVFGDCDKLMSEIMRNVLSKEEKQEWEGGRGERLAELRSKTKTFDHVPFMLNCFLFFHCTW